MIGTVEFFELLNPLQDTCQLHGQLAHRSIASNLLFQFVNFLLQCSNLLIQIVNFTGIVSYTDFHFRNSGLNYHEVVISNDCFHFYFILTNNEIVVEGDNEGDLAFLYLLGVGIYSKLFIILQRNASSCQIVVISYSNCNLIAGQSRSGRSADSQFNLSLQDFHRNRLCSCIVMVIVACNLVPNRVFAGVGFPRNGIKPRTFRIQTIHDSTALSSAFSCQ